MKSPFRLHHDFGFVVVPESFIPGEENDFGGSAPICIKPGDMLRMQVYKSLDPKVTNAQCRSFLRTRKALFIGGLAYELVNMQKQAQCLMYLLYEQIISFDGKRSAKFKKFFPPGSETYMAPHPACAKYSHIGNIGTSDGMGKMMFFCFRATSSKSKNLRSD